MPTVTLERRVADRILDDLVRGDRQAPICLAGAADFYCRRWDRFITDVLGYELQDFHRRWFEHQLLNRRSILLAPRGHGKSIIANISFVLHRIVQNPNTRILIASKTARQAQLFLGEIKSHLEKNVVLRTLYGPMEGEQWREDQITVRRTRLMKEPTVTAIGIGGSLPSWHFDAIIIDDPHDLSNSSTPGQLEKVWRWFTQVCLPTLEPEGEIHVIGTRWHRNDLFGRLMDTSPDYAVLRDPAIRDDGTPLWPGKFDLDELREIERRSPWAFQLQYLCEVGGMLETGPVFDASHFEVIPAEEAEELRERALFVAQAWDVAVGGKEVLGKGTQTPEGLLPGAGDYTACVTVALLPDLRFLVLDWWRGKPPLAGQIRAIIEQAARWEPDVIYIESVAYQAVLANHIMSRTTLPIVPIHPDRDKVRRALTIQPYVTERRVVLSQKVLGLRDLLAAFPYGEEDDSVDAFVYAMQGLARWEGIERARREGGPLAQRRVVEGL